VKKSSFVVRPLLSAAIVSISLVLIPVAAQIGSQTAASAATTFNLLPSAGQYVPISPVKILDTRYGTGEPGGTPAAIGPNGTLSSVPVLGVGAIPPTGVSAVFIAIQEFDATNNGYITDYESDIPNPGHASLSYQANQPATGSDTVLVAPPGSNGEGTISFSSTSSGPVDIGAVVEGYFTDGTPAPAADTYLAVTPATVLDTRTGQGQYGVVQKLAAGASESISTISTQSGTPLTPNGPALGDVSSVELQFGAVNSTQSGYLSISGEYPVALRSMSFNPGEKDNYSDAITPDSNGDITIKNNGSTATDVQVIVDGYFLSPTSSLIGSTYQGLDPVTICDTRSGCSFNGGTTTYELGAYGQSNDAVNIQESGVAGIPTGVSDVANEVNAVAPTASGYLTVDPYQIATPTALPTVNFNAGDNGDETYENTIVSQTSASGAITVTNHSLGSVQVVVSARGYWIPAAVPGEPNSFSSVYDYNSSSAQVSWAPPDSDGGNPITAYDLLVNGIVVGNYGPNVTYATVTASPTDSISVSATNGVGPGAATTAVDADPMQQASAEVLAATAGTSSSAQSQVAVPASQASLLPSVWSGTVTDENGNPIAASVTAFAVPIGDDGDTNVTVQPTPEVPLASGTTGPSGQFNLQASPTSALSGLEASDGTFQTLLYVSTSSFTSVYQESMQIQVPQNLAHGEDNLIVDQPTQSQLTANGSDPTSMAAMWDQSDDVAGTTALSTGASLTVPSGTPSASTDLETNYPEMGPLPVGADTAYENAVVPIPGGSGVSSGTQACGPWGVKVGQGKKWASSFQFAAMPGSQWTWSGTEAAGSTWTSTMSIEVDGTSPTLSFNAGYLEGKAATNQTTLTWGKFNNASGNQDSQLQTISAMLLQLRLMRFPAKCYSGTDAHNIVTCAKSAGYSGPATFLGVWDNAGYSSCFDGVNWKWGSFDGWGNGNKRWGNNGQDTQYAAIYGTGGAYDNEKAYVSSQHTLKACGSGEGLEVDGGGGEVATGSGQTAWSQNDLMLSIGANYSVGVNIGPISVSGNYGLNISGTDTNGSQSDTSHQYWMQNNDGGTNYSAEVCPTVGKYAYSNVPDNTTFFSHGDGNFVGNVSHQD